MANHHPKKIGTFEPNGIIEMRVDKNPSVLIDPARLQSLSKLMKVPTYQWEPATVGFLLWHGNEDDSCGFVGELLQGKELNIRYQTSSLHRDVLSVNLLNAKKSIIDGLGLSKCGA